MKIRMTLITEYEVNKNFYPESATSQEILEMDIRIVQEDGKNILALGRTFKVEGKIIE